MSRRNPRRPAASGVLLAFVLVAGALLSQPLSAQAAAGDIGHAGPSYSGVSNPPTADKPQSKLWWNAGSWWADMWTSAAGGWHIFRLDRSTETWVDTGVTNDTRANTLSDTLWDGTHLYIASHVVTTSTDESPVVSQSGQPAKLYRYSYSGGTYSLDSGFPNQITNNSSESMTIDKDSTGAIWATWTQVAGSASAGYTNTVYVNDSTTGGATWATPFVLPVTNPHPAPDDISAVVAYAGNSIGVMWSDQTPGRNSINWAFRKDGTSPTAAASWRSGSALSGTNQADDHLNLKTLQADSAGRVFAAIKTSLNDTGSGGTAPQLILLVYNPSSGTFTHTTISTTGDCVSRPQIVLDSQNNQIHVFQTAPAPTVSGCSFSGVAGSIYEKTSSTSSPSFSTGRGTPVIVDASSGNLNNVTTTKQTVNSTTGLVVMASNDVTKKYWFADESLGTQTAPTAAFTATPTSGSAPLATTFTDTSTGSPTSWSWTFGDGATSTAESPSHTYTTAGTYTVKLTATNAKGSSTISKAGLITVGASSGAHVTVGGSTSFSSTTASSTVGLSSPSGVATGDVLVATITADATPSVSTVPSGWKAVLSAPLTIATGARVFVYSHVVANAATEPATSSWTLSAAEKWGGGITDYHGVNTATPFDGSIVTTIDSSYNATSLTLPGITTTTAGDVVIGGIGMDSTGTGVTVSQPSGWASAYNSTGGQESEQASVARPTAGASGSATWAFGTARAVAGWSGALKPAP